MGHPKVPQLVVNSAEKRRFDHLFVYAILGGISNALLSQVDLYASLAGLVEEKVQPDDAPDSEEHLAAWLGNTRKGRDVMLEEAFTLGLRMGEWNILNQKLENSQIG